MWDINSSFKDKGEMQLRKPNGKAYILREVQWWIQEAESIYGIKAWIFEPYGQGGE